MNTCCFFGACKTTAARYFLMTFVYTSNARSVLHLWKEQILYVANKFEYRSLATRLWIAYACVQRVFVHDATVSFPPKAEREVCSAQESGGKAVAFGNFSELLHRPKYTRPRCTAARLQRASMSPRGTTRFTFSARPRASKGFNMASEPSRKTTHSSR